MGGLAARLRRVNGGGSKRGAKPGVVKGRGAEWAVSSRRVQRVALARRVPGRMGKGVVTGKRLK